MNKSLSFMGCNRLQSYRTVYLTLRERNKIGSEEMETVQKALMNATGYDTKVVYYIGSETRVRFEGPVVLNNSLEGKGKNELEAVLDACKNLFDDPHKYNTTSLRYVHELKSEAKNEI